MFSTRKLFQVIPVVMMMLASAAAHAQSPSEMRSSKHSPQRCRDADPIRTTRGPADRPDRLFSGTETLAAGELCDDRVAAETPAIVNREDDPPILTRHIDPPSEPPDLASRLPVQPLIRASGEEAAAIVRASAAVLDILRGNNSCSAWFARSDPNIVETFASLQIWIERDGPEHIVRERGETGDWIEHGPYIARTSESTGPGTNIGINANGAFFHGKAEVFKIAWQQGFELPTNTWQNLHVGPYDGATPKAQLITLLHELAHVVGAIPSDGLSPSGLHRSQENTELILRHCRSTVNASPNHTIIELAQKLPD